MNLSMFPPLNLIHIDTEPEATAVFPFKGKISEAETEFIKSGRPKEAVLM